MGKQTQDKLLAPISPMAQLLPRIIAVLQGIPREEDCLMLTVALVTATTEFSVQKRTVMFSGGPTNIFFLQFTGQP